jgi:hypothetical protein
MSNLDDRLVERLDPQQARCRVSIDLDRRRLFPLL